MKTDYRRHLPFIDIQHGRKTNEAFGTNVNRTKNMHRHIFTHRFASLSETIVVEKMILLYT